MAPEGVAGQGCEQVIPARWDDLRQGTLAPRWSIACLTRVLDHHISFDHFLPPLSSLFLLLSPSRTHRKPFFNSNIGPVRHLMSVFFLVICASWVVWSSAPTARSWKEQDPHAVIEQRRRGDSGDSFVPRARRHFLRAKMSCHFGKCTCVPSR